MTREEAIEKLEREKAIMCHGCMHPQMIGWCENHCQMPEALDMAIEALSEDRPKNMIHIDDVYRLIAGHSDYHGDSILSAFTCLVEGKDVKPIAPLDESADKPTEWIPVSEKLPKEGQKIIFTEHDHYAKQRGDGLPEEIVGVGTYFLYKEWNYSLTEHMAKKAEKEGFGKDHVIVYGRRYNDEESEITAWMPLPEPYREDGEA